MGQRQLNRLLKLWVVEAGLDPSDYSVESLRRTKALHILKGTGDLQTVRALLETTTYCPRTPGRRTDLLSFPPAVPRDRADQATARIPRVELAVILQPDSSVACIPAWMTHEAAAQYALTDKPRFSVTILRSLRTEIDALLNFSPKDV